MRRNDSIYATPAQEAYIRRLRAEAFAKRAPVEWGESSRQLLRSAASREIEMLRAALAKVAR